MTTIPAWQRPRGARSTMMPYLFIAAVVLSCVAGFYIHGWLNPPPASTIGGKAWVVDGDTVRVASKHIRLEGIDAPETDQTCLDASGRNWPCGRVATRELRRYIRGRELACVERAIDRYHRPLAVCSLPDNSQINAWMVRQGWALSSGFVKTYEAEEAEAKAAKRGLWAGTFTPPWEWRRQHPRYRDDEKVD